VNVKLPDYPAKPEWKLDGSTVPIPEVTLSTLVSTLRDRIIGQIGSTVSLSRMRLQMGTITLSNSKTLAFYNVADGEGVSLELREVKKK
jgi:splicing factor 3A subunit 1